MSRLGAALMGGLLTALATFAGAQPLASPDPTADEVRRVVEHLLNGKDRGPVLTDLVPCTRIDARRGSPTQGDCLDRVTGSLKKGTPVYAWTAWLVPKDGRYDDIKVRFLLDGQVKASQDLRLEGTSWGAPRVRLAPVAALTALGKWEIKVLKGNQELLSESVLVE